jgi:hypothetical protein
MAFCRVDGKPMGSGNAFLQFHKVRPYSSRWKRRFRQMPEGHDLKIIVLTGWGQDEDRRGSAKAGFDGKAIKKPFSLLASDMHWIRRFANRWRLRQ